MICDKCKYKVTHGKCNSFEVMAMTMAMTHPRLPEYKEFNESEIEYLSKPDTKCWAFEEKIESGE